MKSNFNRATSNLVPATLGLRFKILAAVLALAAFTGPAPAATWFISPTGSDSNTGTSTNAPFATLMHAQSVAVSGDVVNIMAGTYYPATQYAAQLGVYVPVNLITNSGITYQAMPGTRPVFNCSLVNPPGMRIAGFWVAAANVTFQGFDVVAVQENITNSNNQSIGMAAWGSGCTWKEVNVHDGDCVGFYLYSSGLTPNNLFYRCDSYNNAGINSYSYGNADGFGCHPSRGSTNNILRECRAWNNSDDGYDCIEASETVVFDHCWSAMNGNNGGNGNGFKVGGWGSVDQNQIPNPIPAHVVEFCLAADNLAEDGFYLNHQPAGPGAPTLLTNNTSFNNPGGADFDMLQRNPPDFSTNADQTDANDIAGTNVMVVNNIAFGGTLLGDASADETTAGPLCISNSWSVGYTLSAADFLSTTYTQMTNARAADGSLPVIAFMHLVPGNPLTGLGCFVPPPAPSVMGTGTNLVVLTWTASPGATGYNVYRSTTNDAQYSLIGTNVAATNYTDVNLAAGTTYFSNYCYVVTALNPGDESADSAQVCVAPFIGPLIISASASPGSALPGQTVAIAATVTAQNNPIGAVTVDVSALGGPSNQALVSNGAGEYTNSVAISPSTPSAVQTLTVNAADTMGNLSVSYQLFLTVGPLSGAWDGGGTNENWSDGANWVGGTPPGPGSTLDFGGSAGLAPLMDGSYDIFTLTFDGAAGAFTIGASPGNTLTLAGGLTNNSSYSQTLNVPFNLAAPVTLNAATAGLTLGQIITNGGNLLTLAGGAFGITVNGAISGTGGLSCLNPATNTLLGVNTFAGNLAISAGTLLIGGAGQLGGGNYSGAISDSGTLDYNTAATQTLSGMITGGGGLSLAGPGTLILSGANTFSGSTTLAGGTLQVSNTLALQDSTVILNAGGALSFSKGILAATLGGLSGIQNLSLLNASAAAVALTVGVNGGSTTYSGILSGAGGSLTKSGPGTLILAGNNSYGGATSVGAGALQLNSGGNISGTTATVVDGAELVINGGTLTASGLSNIGGGAATGLLVSAGSAGYNGGLTVDLGDDTPVLIEVTGGTLKASSLALGRSSFIQSTQPAAGSTADGLYIKGGTVNITGNLDMSSSSSVASSASARMDNGSLTIGGSATIGLNNGGRWSVLDVNGGALTLTNATTGVSIGGPYSGNAEFLVRNGVATVGRIALGYGEVTNASVLNLTGGALYVGAGGIILVSTNNAATNNLAGGTLGASTNWSCLMPMNLAGATIQAADASGNPQNIALNGRLSGPGGLIKTGPGILILGGSLTNTYAGATTVSNGLLLITNMVRSATSANTVTVASGGALGGNGIVAGAVTVNPGGLLMPGNPFGALTISNKLTLAAGSTTIVEIKHSPLTNSGVNLTGALASGGALIVTNAGGMALASGDSFKLFNAASYSGGFSSVALPPLPSGLGWNTNALNTAGTLAILIIAKPGFTAAAPLQGGLVLSGGGGVAGGTFYLLYATNLSIPAANWTPLSTNQFDANGYFNITNPIVPNSSQNFYQIEIP